MSANGLRGDHVSRLDVLFSRPPWTRLGRPRERENFLNGGPAMHGLGSLGLELQGAMRGISGGFSEPEKLGPTSIWTDGSVPAKSPAKEKG